MTYRECAVQCWKELGWSEEKIKQALEARDRNAAVIAGTTYKQCPAGMERAMIDSLKELESLSEEDKEPIIAAGRELIAKRKQGAINN